MSSPAPPTPRMRAADRREQVVDVAVGHFARTGLHGTSTEAIAREAGVSQPYLFRLFGTKRGLFRAVAARCHARTLATFRAAATGDTPEERLAAMGTAYVEMLSDRTLLLAQMQMFAACEDEEIRAEVREGFGAVYEEIERLSGAGAEKARSFVATGMLLNVAAALGLPEVAAETPWAQRLLERPGEPGEANDNIGLREGGAVA